MIELKRTNWKVVKHDYLTSNITLKDLAAKYHIKVGTLRSHKSRNHWKRGSKSSHKNVATRRNKNTTLHSNVATKINIKSLQKSGLTDKQQNFCIRWLQSRNATKAYRQVYHCALSTAMTNGSALLRNTRVQREITKIRQKNADNIHFNRLDVIIEAIKMLKTDVSDYVIFGHKTEVTDEGEKWQRPYLYFRNQKDIDTSLVNGIKLGKDGAEVQLVDKFKLIKLLMKYLSNPVNHDIKDDSLISALKTGLKQKHNQNNK